jgi:hypothetical protein
VDLEEWFKEEDEKASEVVSLLLGRVGRGEKISLLDFVPEYENILRDKTYGLWIPPGSIQIMLQRPVTNLANMLDKGKPVPSILLVPLNACRSKAEFMTVYGLAPDKGGPPYETFLQEIREGRILPIITENPTHYKADFYQEIFKACEEGEIKQLPPFPLYRTTLFMKRFSLIVSAIWDRIPLEEGWEDLVLQKHSEYEFESWKNEARNILSDEAVQIIQKKYPFMQDKELVASTVATRAYELSVFGFSSLANRSPELLREDPLLGYSVLEVYVNYLVSGYSNGLGGLRMYDRVDLENMTILGLLREPGLLSRFLGAIKKRKGAPTLEEAIMASPADFSVVGSAVELPIVARIDVDDLRNSLKRGRDGELEKNMLEAMRAFHSYDFAKFREKNETINEIIAERISKETRSYYRWSKIAEATFVAGGTLTLAAGAMAVYQHLQPLLSLYSVFAGKTFEAMIKNREYVAKWLVSRWPFQQKGLPYHLWLHNIKPDKIKKSLST